MSQDWSHADRLKRLLEAAVMNTELRQHCEHRKDETHDLDDALEYQEKAVDYLWYRNHAMEELGRAFELYGRLEEIIAQVDLYGQDRVRVARILARIDERLRAPGVRS